MATTAEADGSAPKAERLRAFELLERSAKVILASLAVLYCVGILIANVSLISLGITDFSSFKAKFVLTGAWPVTMVLICSVPWLLQQMWLFWNKNPSVEDKKAAFSAVRSGLAASTFLFFSIFWVSFGLHWYEVLVTFLVLTLLSRVVVNAGFFTGKPDTADETPEEKKLRVILLLVLSLLVAVVIGLWQFDSSAYFKIPQQLGGGKPLPARLVLTKDGAEFWSKVGGSQEECGHRFTYEVQLYQETEHDLVLKRNESYDSTIVIKKDLVDGIQAEPLKEDHFILNWYLNQIERFARWRARKHAGPR